MYACLFPVLRFFPVGTVTPSRVTPDAKSVAVLPEMLPDDELARLALSAACITPAVSMHSMQSSYPRSNPELVEDDGDEAAGEDGW